MKPPDSVPLHATPIYQQVNELRREIKATAAKVNECRGTWLMQAEAIENLTLAYRHLEDASMRLGKALQALDGGVSVYDRETTVGA